MKSQNTASLALGEYGNVCHYWWRVEEREAGLPQNSSLSLQVSKVSEHTDRPWLTLRDSILEKCPVALVFPTLQGTVLRFFLFLLTEGDWLSDVDMSQIPMRPFQNINKLIHSDKYISQRLQEALECDQTILSSRGKVTWESKLHFKKAVGWCSHKYHQGMINCAAQLHF